MCTSQSKLSEQPIEKEKEKENEKEKEKNIHYRKLYKQKLSCNTNDYLEDNLASNESESIPSSQVTNSDSSFSSSYNLPRIHVSYVSTNEEIKLIREKEHAKPLAIYNFFKRTSSNSSINKHSKTKRRKVIRRINIIVDGLGQSFYKRIAETVLVLSVFFWAVFKNKEIIIKNYIEVSIWAVSLFYYFFFNYRSCVYTTLLYTLTLPLMISLSLYTNSNKNINNNNNYDIFKLNLLLSFFSLPKFTFKNFFFLALSTKFPQIWELSIVRDDLIKLFFTLSSTSLTETEIILFTDLLMNLLFTANSPEIIILQGLIFGSTFIFNYCWYFISKIINLSMIPPQRRPANAAERKQKYAKYTAILYISGLLILVRTYLHIRLHKEPFIWLVQFFSYNLNIRIEIIVYWLICLGITLSTFACYAPNWKRVDLRRKMWHILVVIMFLLCGVNVDAQFTSFCMGAAFCVFLLSELIRCAAIPPFGHWLQIKLLPFTDARDTCGPLIVSHIFLLLGISLPIFFAYSPAGIICLGLGDATASILGREYGVHKWFDSNKTIEGSLGFMFAVVFTISFLQHASGMFLGIAQKIQDSGFDNLFFTITSTILYKLSNLFIYYSRMYSGLGITTKLILGGVPALLEAFSGMNDNVLVPVVMFVVERLLVA